MNAFIVRGRDRHTVRLEEGLRSCGITMDPNGENDLLFVDPSCDKTQIPLGFKYRMFFDTEDDPRHFDPGPMYWRNKNIIKHYAKMNFYDDDFRGDGIKNIGFPLSIYRTCIDIANMDRPITNKFIPTLISSPTFIGRYEPIENGIYNSEEKLTCLGKHEEGHLMYNQRVDWLLSLRKNKIRYQGGIVFHNDGNLSYSWQSKYFGPKIASLSTQPISYADTIKLLLENRVGLCPTGHDRLSWRTYDIMAAGAILIRTDHKKQLALINPKEYITIQDGQDLGTELTKYYPLFNDIHRHHQVNREIFKNLTPEKIQQLFLNQLG